MAVEYGRVAELMMRTVASRAIGKLDEVGGPDRYVALKFLLDSEFLDSGACSRKDCRARYAMLVDDFNTLMTNIYESKRDRMEDTGSWVGFTELWGEWFEIKILVGQLRSALILYDLGLPIAVKIARRAGDHVVKMCPRLPAPVIPIRPTF